MFTVHVQYILSDLSITCKKIHWYARWYVMVTRSKNSETKKMPLMDEKLTWYVYILQTTKWRTLKVNLLNFIKFLYLKMLMYNFI